MKIFAHHKIVVHNEKTGERNPVFMVIDNEGEFYQGDRIELKGSSIVNYDPTKISDSRIWIETEDDIVLYSKDVKFIIKNSEKSRKLT